LLQSINTNDQRVLENAGQRIDLITSELQEAIMLTRMQPIGNVFNKFPRVVRDLAGNLGKQVKLDLQGKEVELDKTIIEAINDPLTHLVRNSVDHGIEKPNDRKKMGKNITGKVLLRAYHEAGQVNIEISDDGRGLDGNKLASAAVAKGLITEDQAKAMSDKERVNLIFLPGFSTADKVTDVSGRGVGMDVVKTNLDKLGGVVDIDSSIGQGTTINIKLPLTLAIIPSQIISTGGERYAIPQVNMEELLRIPADQVKDRVEKVGDAEVVRLRGDLLPLIKLADIIGVELTYRNPEDNELKSDRRQNIADRRSKKSPLFDEDSFEKEQGDGNSQLEFSDDNLSARNQDDRRYHADSALNIVVVSTGAMKYGLVVDQLHDSEEIVVKPLGRDLKQCKGYAGATIMGDGRVALILDVANLALMAELTSLDSTDRAAEVAEEAEEDAKIKGYKQSLLLFRSSVDEQFGVSLNQVQRIEKIKVTDIEEVGGKRVMQYRGGSLPLYSIDEVAQVKPLDDREDILVIVFIIAEREIGLLAIGPVDAVETALDVDEMSLKQPGILGSAIIGKHTTQLVDVFGLVQTVKPEWFPEGEEAHHPGREAATILFAEDSDFFRNQVKGFMEEVGYNVIEAEDGMIAWDLLQENADKVSLVVTDIEMPNLDGFELTRMIRQDERYSELPVVALTTLASDEDINKGKNIGINDYQIKLDKEKLMASVQSHLIRK
jgi:two-component system chemotaxis sensor kinase CheA